jgi:hypothetical protein
LTLKILGRGAFAFLPLDGEQMVTWIRRHCVGVHFVLTLLWLALAALQIISIAGGDAGPNGGHIFQLALALVVAALSAAAAVLTLVSKKKKSSQEQLARPEEDRNEAE